MKLIYNHQHYNNGKERNLIKQIITVIVELVLQDCVKRIREDYERDWKSKEMRLRQRFVNNTYNITELLHNKHLNVLYTLYISASILNCC